MITVRFECWKYVLIGWLWGRVQGCKYNNNTVISGIAGICCQRFLVYGMPMTMPKAKPKNKGGKNSQCSAKTALLYHEVDILFPMQEFISSFLISLLYHEVDILFSVPEFLYFFISFKFLISYFLFRFSTQRFLFFKAEFTFSYFFLLA